ncbi:MAG: type II toxin-antitoxin system Phd/YefM family antitoxin [Patescibacteria group bacterium]
MDHTGVKEPKIVLEKGKPSLVLLDINQYKNLLEKAEDLEDLRELRKLRAQKLSFRPLDEFLAEYSPNVSRSH